MHRTAGICKDFSLKLFVVASPPLTLQTEGFFCMVALSCLPFMLKLNGNYPDFNCSLELATITVLG